MAEFDLIHEHFLWQGIPDSVLVGVGDDAAVLIPPRKKHLVISVDTFNAGVHFPLETSPHAVGYKALAVNLSDLAAMGAEPAWFTLALSLPDINPSWVAEFARGMRELAQQHGIFLIGGDTTRGSLSITIQVMGFVEPGKALLRSQAKHGDWVCVSGFLGDAAAGLAIVQKRLKLPSELADYCVQRLNYPTPRTFLAGILQGRAHACQDISDGLLADLGHILKASGVGARLEHEQLPISTALQHLPLAERLEFALTGGDDYELLFTLSPTVLDEVQDLANKQGILVTPIGKIDGNSSEIELNYKLSSNKRGYEHFSLLS